MLPSPRRSDDPLDVLLRRDPSLLALLLVLDCDRARANWARAASLLRPRAAYGGLSLPAPTAALPGTPEKVAVLTERARARRALWGPGDATWEKDERAGLVEDDAPANGGNHRCAVDRPEYRAASTTGRRVVREG